MSVINELLRLRTATSTRHSGTRDLLWLLSDFKCLNKDSLLIKGLDSVYVPPLVCKFNANGLHGHLLAVADEEGFVALYDTRKPLSKAQLSLFGSHRNAVFDISWVPEGTKLVTASGDKTLCLWDVIGERLLTTFRGHHGSVKSVHVKQDEPSVSVSGSRDGSIMVWDTRCTGKGLSQKPVNIIHCAHERDRGGGKSRSSARHLASVTTVLFHGDNKIASCGAADGTVKLWDMRRYYTTNKRVPPPCWHSFATVEKGGRAFGFNSLVSDLYESSLFASCTDDIIYKYSTANLNKTPVDAYSGHRNSMFYVKACLSGDGEYLLSGSNCGAAYIWKVTDSRTPPLLLQGHTKEVTAVDWCPTSLDKVATCSDDNDLFLWRVSRDGKGGGQEGGVASYDVQGTCVQYSGEDHLKAQKALESYRQSTREEIKTKRDCTPSSQHTPSQKTPSSLSPLCTNTSLAETKSTLSTPSTRGHSKSTEETPTTNSAATGQSRKRKLIWTTGTENKKLRKGDTCSKCGTSAAGSTVTKEQTLTCSKCVRRTQPSLQSFFKPKQKE